MRKIFMMSSLLSALLLTGCTNFQVKNTDGLRLAYEDVERASSKGSQLRALTNVTDAQRQEAANLYRDAKAVINAYFQQSITDASAYVVNENAESYKATKGSEKVAAFQKSVNVLQGTTTKEWFPVATSVVTSIIEEIINLNDQEQKAAYDRFVATVNKYMMKNFEELPSGRRKMETEPRY